jgi:hypothetical protein
VEQRLDEEKVVVLKFNKKQDGPLLEMFESPLFTSHMAVVYVYQMNRANVVEYLCNKLFREHGNDMVFLDLYLPQLW